MRQRGLKACVIRALHYSYFTSLLLRHIGDTAYFRQEEPHSLIRRRCTYMWHKVRYKLLNIIKKIKYF